jgi:hypothetical protein
VLPKFAKDLKLRLEPKLTKSKTERELPSALIPYSEREEPHLAKLLMERELPRFTKSRTDKLLPNFEIPYNEKELPKRV